MNKASNNHDKPPLYTNNSNKQTQNMKIKNHQPPINKKIDYQYDNTADDYILDSDTGNNELQKILGPFNFNYNTTNNASGNIYGNMSVNNINIPNNPNPKEEKEILFFKDAFNNLLGQYTSMTHSLINSNFFKDEKREIKRDEELKNEELNSFIACILNM